MDVFVFGVGGSGTTMMYRLVQEIYLANFGRDFDSIYEPFLWSPEIFNKLYEETTDSFGKTDSLSIEGMYAHLKTPLFVTQPGARTEYLKLDLFRHLSNEQSQQIPRVAKLIRGNGRMAIFRLLNPEAKFVLITRNPTDNVNSVKNKFSFFGDDFYPSDWPRFVNECGNNLIRNETENDWAGCQAEYSCQMSRAAVEFALSDKKTMIIEYDNFRVTPEESIESLSDFLGFAPQRRFVDQVAKPTGPVKRSIALDQTEFESVFAYDRHYGDICTRAGISRKLAGTLVHKKYNQNCNSEPARKEFHGLTTNRLRNILLQRERQLEALRQKIAQIEQTGHSVEGGS